MAGCEQSMDEFNAKVKQEDESSNDTTAQGIQSLYIGKNLKSYCNNVNLTKKSKYLELDLVLDSI